MHQLLRTENKANSVNFAVLLGKELSPSSKG
jgi:hypothetical protein